MKRLLFLLIVVAVGTVFLADRVTWLRQAMPWLPHWPWGQTQTATNATEGGNADEGGGRRHRGGGGRGGRGEGGNGPTPVLVAQSRYDDLPVTVDILGTVQATNNVTVRSQVDGKLIQVAFQEGQTVKRGDLLARIDPSIYQASYDQAVAKKAQDDSILANARLDLGRYVNLAATQYGSHQQADQQKALVTQTEAIVQQDQAAIDSAKATLGYTTITSPLDGRTGIRLVDQGNIVHASDTTGIVTVAEVQPIAIVFNLPQQYLASVNAALAKGPLRAEARDGDDRVVLDTGVLQVVDNTIDQTTGTVKLKASFPNANLQLWPGQFVNVRLYVDKLSHVVVVPTPAVQRGPDGTFVYVVGDNDTVKMQPVTVGRQTESDSVVTTGLSVPSTIVTTGFTRLIDGGKVSISSGPAAAAPGGGATGTASAAGTQPGPPGPATAADAESGAPAPTDAGVPDDASKDQPGRHHRHKGEHRRNQDDAGNQGNASSSAAGSD